MSSQGVQSSNPLFGNDKPDFTRLAGLGAGAIVATHSSTGKTAAVTNAINFTPPAVVGLYRVFAAVDVTAWTTPASFQITIAWKDASGSAQSGTMVTVRFSSSALAASITAVDIFLGIPCLLQIDNSATAITVSTSGTFTGSPVYNLAAVLERLV